MPKEQHHHQKGGSRVTAMMPDGIILPTATLGAYKIVRPLDVEQIFRAGLLCRKPLGKSAETLFLFLCHNSTTS